MGGKSPGIHKISGYVEFLYGGVIKNKTLHTIKQSLIWLYTSLLSNCHLRRHHCDPHYHQKMRIGPYLTGFGFDFLFL